MLVVLAVLRLLPNYWVGSEHSLAVKLGLVQGALSCHQVHGFCGSRRDSVS